MNLSSSLSRVIQWPELISDLHLDHYSKDEEAEWVIGMVLGLDIEHRKEQEEDKVMENNRGPLLVAGDLASVHSKLGRKRWMRFIELALLVHPYIIVIAGNHEYYGGLAEETIPILRTLLSRLSTDEHRVIFLEQEIWHHPTDNYCIAGCTLWSHVPKHAQHAVQYYLSDYSQIRENGDQDIRVAWTNKMHQSSKQWLTDVILSISPTWMSEPNAETSNATNLIILTHHAPLLNEGCSPAQYRDKLTTHGFESDLSDLVPCVSAWCFGHTHYSTKIQYNKETVLYSNQLGYQDESTGFMPRCIVNPIVIL